MKSPKLIEIENDNKHSVWAMACRVKNDVNKIYIHLANERKDLHDGIAKKVGASEYAILEINEVEC